MQWAYQVKPWRIRRLYRFARSAIYDDELLLEVGWGLYTRCQDALTVAHAYYRGKVPCPRCGEIVHRSKLTRRFAIDEKRSPSPRFSCPSCGTTCEWRDFREALRTQPRCFKCQVLLNWSYASDQLTCNHCGENWTWQQYLRSIRNRTRLPCPHCSSAISRSKLIPQDTHGSDHPTNVPPPREELICPRCRSSAVHTEGKLRCVQCGYEKPWSVYRKRLKRRVERLKCERCGHAFTWDTWRRQPQVRSLFTANVGAVGEFLAQWPQCRSPQEKLMQIDGLLRTLHGRGAMAPVFIEGDEGTIMELLDELAQQH